MTRPEEPGGVPPGFRMVYEEHFAAVFRYAARCLNDADLADDLAQEAFVRFLGSSVPDREARPWLFRVVTNLIRDERRRRVRRARLLRRWLPRGGGVTEASEAEAALTKRAVRQALAELTDAERRILLLREEGLSYGEIAAAAGISRNSVGALLTRARKRFRETYERA